MDDPLRLIQYLYDEEVDDPTFARRLTEDETLYREYERLRVTKEDLDNRSSRRPDPAVVDQVVDQARTAAQESTASPSSPNDRPPRRPFPTWTRRLQTVSAGLALVLLVGLGWWREGGLVGDPMEGSSESAQQAPPTVVEGREQDEQSIPTWDDSDELVRIHRRLEQIQTHSASNAWGALQSASRTRP